MSHFLLILVKQDWGQRLASLVPELGQYKASWNTTVRSRLVGRVKDSPKDRYEGSEIGLEGTEET